jgi:hypothetical protein
VRTAVELCLGCAARGRFVSGAGKGCFGKNARGGAPKLGQPERESGNRTAAQKESTAVCAAGCDVWTRREQPDRPFENRRARSDTEVVAARGMTALATISQGFS